MAWEKIGEYVAGGLDSDDDRAWREVVKAFHGRDDLKKVSRFGLVLLLMRHLTIDYKSQIRALKAQIASRETKGFDTLEINVDPIVEDRTLVFRFKTAAGVHAQAVKVRGAMLSRGIFEPGSNYEAGDVVTHRKGVWVARDDTTATPGDGETPWLLFARSGRDGRDASK